jgi:tetratricopeptide (TPR) repeat protein
MKKSAFYVSYPAMLMLSVFLLTSMFGCASLLSKYDPTRSSQVPSSDNQDNEQIHHVTQEKIQTAVMRFSDRFLAIFGQAATQMENHIDTHRVDLIRLKLYTMAASFEIASGPYPGLDLLNMLVLVTLNRIVWEDHWQPKVYGQPAEGMVAASRVLETDIWSVAGKWMTLQQREELLELIHEWRNKFPDQTYVTSIRFDNLGKLSPETELDTALQPGGFLAPVSIAGRAVEETRHTLERAIYLVSRMQLLVSNQIELAYEDLATQPDVAKLLADAGRFNEMLEKFVELVEKMPEQMTVQSQIVLQQTMQEISKERESAINQIMNGVADERENIVREFVSQEKQLHGMLTELQKTMKAGNELLSSADTLVARFDFTPSSDDAKPFDINDYRSTASEITRIVQQSNLLLDSLNGLLASPALEQRLPQLFEIIARTENESEKFSNHLFRQGVALILILILGTLFAMLTYRLVCNRFFKSTQGQSGYANFKEYIKTIQRYDKAIGSDPGDAKAYSNRGVAYAKLNQHIKAIQDYDKAIKADPGDAKAYNNRGVAYAGLKEYVKAIQNYNKAIALDPGYAKAYSNRGVAYIILERVSRGCSDLKKACKLGECRGWKIAKKRGLCS